MNAIEQLKRIPIGSIFTAHSCKMLYPSKCKFRWAEYDKWNTGVFLWKIGEYRPLTIPEQSFVLLTSKLKSFFDLIGDDEILAYKECEPLTEAEAFPPTFALTRGSEHGLRFWTRYRTNWYCDRPTVAGNEIRLWAALLNLNPKGLI